MGTVVPAKSQSKMVDEEVEVQNMEATTTLPSQEEERHCRSTRLPQTRVRNMMKLDPDLQLASQESVLIITKAAELFVEHFAREAFKRTTKGKRKTIQKRDLDATINENDEMAFLEGALE